MLNEEKSKAISERLGRFNMLWPDVTTEKGIADAVKGGAAAAGYIAVAYGLAVIFLLTGWGGTGTDAPDMLAMLAAKGALAAGACVLAWLIWKKSHFIAAAVGLAWIAFEVAARIATMSNGRGMVLAILALIFAVNGLRGTLALKRQAAPQAPTAA